MLAPTTRLPGLPYFRQSRSRIDKPAALSRLYAIHKEVQERLRENSNTLTVVCCALGL
jgi:hypothetical protein